MSTETINRGRNRRRWAMLGIACSSALSVNVTQQGISPVLPLVMQELGLNYTEAGLLMSMASVPALLLAIVAGMLADRYGLRKLFSGALGIVLAGTSVVATGGSLGVLLAGRLIAGVGTVMLTVLAGKMVAQWFAGREMGTAMGTYNTAGAPLGTICAMTILPLLASSFGWRGAIEMAMAVPALALVLFNVFYRPVQPAGSAPRKGLGGFRALREVGLPMWLFGIAQVGWNGAASCILAFTPVFLNSSGFSLVNAGLLTSAFMWPGLFLSIPMGYGVDRLGHKRLMMAAGGLALAAFTLLIPVYAGAALLIMLLVGLSKVPIPPAGLALTPELVRPDRTGLAFGISATCSSLGGVIGPTTAGWARDFSGSYTPSYVIMACLSLLLPVCMGVSWLLARRAAVARMV